MKSMMGLPVGSRFLDESGEEVNFDLFLSTSRQKVLTIDMGLSPTDKMDSWLSFPYEVLCKYAGIAWDGFNKSSAPMYGIVRWAHDGFHTLEAHSDVYAAALMCTTAESVGFGDIHFPSTSIVFRIPPGLVDAEYARMDISSLGEVSLHVCGGTRHRTVFMTSDTVDDLLFVPFDVSDDFLAESNDERFTGEEKLKVRTVAERGVGVRNATSDEQRMFVMVRHYVAGMLIAYQVKSNWKYEGLRLAQAKQIRGVPPQHRYVVLGRGVRADVREGVKRYVNGTTHKSPAFQFVVRGHYRNQSCGPQHSLRRIQWIEPFWKPGKNVDAPVLARSIFQ